MTTAMWVFAGATLGAIASGLLAIATELARLRAAIIETAALDRMHATTLREMSAESVRLARCMEAVMAKVQAANERDRSADQ